MASAPWLTVNPSPYFSRASLIAFFGKNLSLLEGRFLSVEDEVRLEIEDPLQFPERHIEEDSDLAWDALEKPDVGDRRGKPDVTHPFPPHLRLDHFDPAFLADDAPVFHALVLAAVALVILGGAEDLGAEEAVFFGLEGPIVDRLRLLHLSMGPGLDLLGRGDVMRMALKMMGLFTFSWKKMKIFQGFLLFGWQGENDMGEGGTRGLPSSSPACSMLSLVCRALDFSLSCPPSVPCRGRGSEAP